MKQNLSNFLKKFSKQAKKFNKFDYESLIKNLDKESITVVDKVLSGVKKPNKNMIFSETEKELKLTIDENFYSKIEKTENNLYKWKEFILPIQHFEVNVFWYKHFLDELNECSKNRVKTKSIIDVGAFIGDSAIVFENFTDKKIYSFEPSTKNYDLMLKTLEYNNCTKTVPIKLFLSDEKSKEFVLQVESSSSQLFDGKDFFKKKELETVNSTTLDDYVLENNIDVGLIKVDIEGAEQMFLKGAENTIKTQRPVLLLSIYHNASDFFNIKKIIENLDLNYNFRIVKPFTGDCVLETTLIAEPID